MKVVDDARDACASCKLFKQQFASKMLCSTKVAEFTEQYSAYNVQSSSIG